MKKIILKCMPLLALFVTNARAQWTTSGSVIYATDSSKNVSVGTLVNGANFYVQKSAAVNLGIKSQTLSATMFMDKGNVTANAAFAYKSLGVTLWNSGMLGGTNFSIKNVALNTSPLLINNTNDYITLAGSGTARVGVGTVAPTVKLDVSGDIKSSATVFANGGNSTNWNTAYSWGNHATAGYLTGNSVWGLTGNAGTNSGTNFIGTTDTASFIIKTNNQLSGFLAGGSEANTSYGYQALMSNTNYNNTAIGYNTLKLNTTGGYNTAIGTYCMLNNTAGYQNTAVGSNSLQSNQNGNFNAAFGYGALLNNSTGNANTAVGNLALLNNTAGSDNSAIGSESLYANTTGTANTAIGKNSLYSNTTANENTATGYYSLYANTTGNLNSAFGSFALQSNTTGSSNTACGNSALYSNTEGNFNSALGVGALSSNTSGFYNTAIGNSSLSQNTYGTENTAVGNQSLKANSTGGSNTALGSFALKANTTGQLNTACGRSALEWNITGAENTANGYGALANNNSGSYNTSFGSYALVGNTTASQNIAIGTKALFSQSFSYNGVTYSSDNVAIGVEALYNNQPYKNVLNFEGVSNTAVGNYAMYSNTYGIGNTSIGYHSLYNGNGVTNTAVGFFADASSASVNQATALGQNSVVNASGKVRIGSSGVSVIEGQVAYSFPSDARFKSNIQENVPGLDFINKLQPITYKFDTKKFDKHLMQNMPDSIQEQRMKGQDYTTSSNIIHSGFLAQDIEKICKDLGYDFDGLHIADPKNPTDNYSIAYSQFVPSLVKAVQEVDKENSELKSKVSSLEKTIQQMQQCLNVLCENNERTNVTKSDNSLAIQIAPNPTNGLAHITISGNEKLQSLTIKILDSAGKLIRSFAASSSQTVIEFNTSSYSKGTYAVQLLNDNEIIKVEKLIVQ